MVLIILLKPNRGNVRASAESIFAISLLVACRKKGAENGLEERRIFFLGA